MAASVQGPVLVTGGSGFVGRSLIRNLLAAGIPVRALTRRPLPDAPRPEGLQVIQGDITDPASLVPALAGVEAVVHLAGSLGLGARPEALEAVNVLGTRHVALAARQAGTPLFVHVSSAGVYGDGDGTLPRDESAPLRPSTPYEHSKLEGEEAARAALARSATALVTLRPAGLYGPGRAESLHFVATVSRRRLWLHGPARILLHPTHVHDLVSAVRLVLAAGARPGAITAGAANERIFNVAGERAVTFTELVDALAERLETNPMHLRLPAAAGKILAAGGRLACAAARRPVPEPVARLAGGVVNRTLDCARLRRELGWTPQPLDQGLDELVAAATAFRPPRPGPLP